MMGFSVAVIGVACMYYKHLEFIKEGKSYSSDFVISYRVV
jgi:hypothetical protein